MALLHWCAGSFYCCTAWLLLLGDRPVHAFQVLPTPPVAYFSSHRRNKAALRLRLRSPRLAASSTSATTTDDDSNLFFATTAPVSDSAHLSVAAATTGTAPSTENSPVQQQKQRVLGSQELLMLPRQYGPGSTTFPPMNHVAVYVLSSTPTVPDLQKAIDSVIVAHPLLSAHVQGDGEPTRRIDMMQMVRDGEPSPLTFVVDNTITADRVLRLVESDNVRASWQTAFVRDLDDGSWCQTDQGPLWKVELHIHQLKSPTQGAKSDLDECALLFSFNHAISDQSSANRLTDAILQSLSEIESTGGSVVTPPVLQSMPVALEDSVLGREQRWSDVQTAGVTFDTIQYVAGKAAEGLKNPVILPDPTPIGGSSKDGDNDENSKSNAGNPLTWALTIISGRAAGGEDSDSRARRSTVQFRSLSQSATEALAVACRARGVSMSNALTAAATFTTTDFIGTRPVGGIQGGEQRKMRNYKALQSLDMRRFGAQLDKGETVACMAGSHDLIHGSLADWSGETLRKNPSEKRLAQFWSLAADGKQQTEDFIAGGGPIQAVRVFDFAMTIADLNNLVHLTAQSKDTKGRAYSVGVTNVGVYERQVGFQRKGETERHLLKIQNGKYKIKDVYYATPHVTSGCLFQVSGMTLDGQLKLTFNPVEPIISSETNARFADAFVGLLEKISGKPEDHNDDLDAKTSPTTLLSLLPTITAGIGFLAVASHAGAWSRFISSVLEMKANIADPADFWAALNFWIFFAVGHPVLQPILWISDVLHGSPGPMIAGLVPVSFLLGNLIAITVILNSKEVYYYHEYHLRTEFFLFTNMMTYYFAV